MGFVIKLVSTGDTILSFSSYFNHGHSALHRFTFFITYLTFPISSKPTIIVSTLIMPGSIPKLFQPVKVGQVNLKHRVVMAPLTRFRADSQHVHTGLGVEYYAQRASTPGTLLLAEATFIAAKAGGLRNVPALETDAQLVAWRNVRSNSHCICSIWMILRRFSRMLCLDHKRSP